MATGVVLMGAAVAVAVSYFGGVNMIAALGLFSGGTTNTPSLGAAQQMLKALPDLADQAGVPALAYAVAYPGGVVGIISVLLLLRVMFRIQPQQEAEAFRAEQRGSVAPLERMNLIVENGNVEGLRINDVPGREGGVAVSRIQRSGTGEVETATDQTVLRRGRRHIVTEVDRRKRARHRLHQ
jgi:putative transport protein